MFTLKTVTHFTLYSLESIGMSTEWWIRKNSLEKGPYSPKELKAFAVSGKLQKETPVRKGENGKWLRASKIKGLFPEDSLEVSGDKTSKPTLKNRASEKVNSQPVSLTVSYPGQFFLFDVEVKLELDGKPVGTGYVKKGIDSTISCLTGTRKLEVSFLNKKTEYYLPLNKPGEWTIHLKYNKAKGGFDDEYQLMDPEGSDVDTNDPHAFECHILKNAAIGQERVMPLSLFFGAPFRDSIVRVQDNRFDLKARAQGGELNSLVEIPGNEVVGLEIVPFGFIDVCKQFLKIFLLAVLNYSIVIGLTTILSMGFSDWIRYINIVLPGCLVGGLVLAGMFVLIPTLLSGRRFSNAFQVELPSGKLLLLTPESEFERGKKIMQALSGLSGVP